MGHRYVGALGFADDISLLAPSLHAARRMIVICEQFAKEYFILFNGSKSKLLVFRHSGDASADQSIQVGNSVVTEILCDTHLGHKLSTVELDRVIVQDSIRSFWGFYNSMITDFGHVRPYLLCNLFKTYCCSYYGSPIWDMSKSIDKIGSTWRCALKRFWNVPRETHREIITLLSDSILIALCLYKRFLKFVKVAHNGPSITTKSVMKIAVHNPMSTFGKNCNLISHSFDLDIDRFPTVNLDFKEMWYSHTDRLQDKVHALREMLIARYEKTVDEGLDDDDVEALVFMLAAG